ncbi:MAG: PAS domain S-box protein, partial [Verrucomicrobiota bacterium]|nr:PAS domain S-box protein [Verrucomicrobiota bacterium]
CALSIRMSQHPLPQALSDAEYRALWETSTDAIVILDRESDVRYANPAVTNIFGYAPEEIVGQNVAIIQPERLREAHRRGMGRFLATGTRTLNWKAVEAVGLHRNGQEFPIEIAFTHLSPGSGNDLFAAFIRDTSDRKEIEQALRRSEEDLRALANSIPQLAWMAHPDGHIFWYNRGWYEYTGTTLAEMEGWGWEKVHDPAFLPLVMERWTASVNTRQPFEMEFPLRSAAGDYQWFLTRVNPVLDELGAVVRWFGTNTNVDRVKRAEADRERLLASEKEARERAERETRMKDEFLATVSHELRTPLNAVLGWATILRDSPTPDEVAEGVAVIERNARAQAEIIEDLLDMNRIISGKVRLDVQRVDLVPIIEAAIESVKPTAAVREIRLTSVLDPHVGPVSADPGRLQQVLWNLLTNAVKFTPKGGRVHLALGRVNSHLEISVSDTGEGITSEFLPHVFDRFRQADATTTRRHRGLGLGLAIVKNLVELHGGSVSAESAGLNQGATFYVCLPATAATLSPDPDRLHPRTALPRELPGEHPDLSGLEILAVDDEPDARELIHRILSRCGAAVETASSGADALRSITKKKPHVLIMDIGMPEEDGYAVIQKVRQLSPEQGGDVPAIALTAFARLEDRRRAILSGFQMHMSKPVEASELIAIVSSLGTRTRS